VAKESLRIFMAFKLDVADISSEISVIF